jgi:hypothetical protein
MSLSIRVRNISSIQKKNMSSAIKCGWLEAYKIICILTDSHTEKFLRRHLTCRYFLEASITISGSK